MLLRWAVHIIEMSTGGGDDPPEIESDGGCEYTPGSVNTHSVET